MAEEPSGGEMKPYSDYRSLEDIWVDLCDASPAPPNEGQRIIWFAGAAAGFALANGSAAQREAAQRDLTAVGTAAIKKAAGRG